MCGTCGCQSEVATSVEVVPATAASGLRRTTIEIQRKVLDKNDALARKLRHRFAHAGVLVVNVVSSPGSGKTELLLHTLLNFSEQYRCVAVTGDLATENDAARLAKSGTPSRQIVTGTLCHLEADLVEEAISGWDLDALDLLFVENVGNLVCPGNFDLGEDLRVVLIATTEGEDKPLKYPALVHTAHAAVISKLDLAAVLECDVDLVERNLDEVNPGIPHFPLSAKSGAGMEEWLEFLSNHVAAKRRAADQLKAQGAHHHHA